MSHSTNAEDADSQGEEASNDTAAGILRHPVSEAELADLGWQEGLEEIDGSFNRHTRVIAINNRAQSLESEAPTLASVLRLLSATVSMHFVANTPRPFVAAFRMSNCRSAAPEDLGQYDLAALSVMAKQTHLPWLKARLSDVALIVSQAHGVPSWQLGGLAARAYLEHAKREGPEEHAVDRLESLQRAMEVGWRYLRKDEAFHTQLWEIAMVLLRQGLAESWPGISMPIAHEIIQRHSNLAPVAAELFDQQAEALYAQEPTPLAANIFREAGDLWHAAKQADRAKSSRHRSADVLIALARTPAQAMLQADWMLEGIAILRRNQGDRSYIRELQAELATIRLRIVGEMSAVSHEIDVTEIRDHVRTRMSADSLPDALLQIAFAFSQWTNSSRARSRVVETAERFVFSSMFRQVTYDENGVPISVTQPFDANNEEELERRIVHDIAQYEHPLLAQIAIPYGIDILQMHFEPTLSDMIGLLLESPVTPRGHEWSLARGLLAGLNHDWHEAAVFLIPQAEPFVRAAFKRQGVHTLSNNSEGAEEEKSLNELLAHTEVLSVLSPDIILELKTLLTHKSGHNLRNRYGHGLIPDEGLASVGTVILWWTMLRLILWPYRGRAIELIQQADAACRPPGS